MSLTIDLHGSTIEVVGGSRIERAQLASLFFDVELAADDAGNASIVLSLPDRRIIWARSAPIPGDMLYAFKAALSQGDALSIEYRGRDVEGCEELTSQLNWCLLDFSGNCARARRLAEQHRYMEAARAAQLALETYPDMAGLRVVLAKILIANGKYREARLPLDEECQRFPQSFRALTALAEIECKELHPAEATTLLERALAMYPYDLQACLLHADLLLRSQEEADVRSATGLLARALRLSGSLDPAHVHNVLKHRLREDLFDDICAEAFAQAPQPPQEQPPASVPPASETQPLSPAPLASQAPKQSSKGKAVFTCDEVTAEDVLRMTARGIFRDGAISSRERKMFQNVCARFPLGSDRVAAIVAEEKKGRSSRGEQAGEFEPAQLFQDILERVYADGALSKNEGTIIMAVARALGLSKDVCLEIKQKVLGN